MIKVLLAAIASERRIDRIIFMVSSWDGKEREKDERREKRCRDYKSKSVR